MAQYTAESSGNKFLIKDSAGNPIFGVHMVGEGETTSFPVLVMDVSGTSYYYWPNSSGVLRYGTTAPTTSTQDTAGSAV
jgi:hypothetical protein